jgi:hypothetical protein
MGDTPSGEALKTAESGLVNKAKQRMVNFGNSWEDCMTMSIRIQRAFGTSEFNDEEVDLDTLWDDPETRNEQSHLESLRIKAELGVSRDQILSELGYDDDQIAQMRIATRIEQRAQSNIGAELLRQFDAGNPEEEA